MTETASQKTKRYEKNQLEVLKQLFWAFLPAQIFSAFASMLAGIVSGIIVGNCLGEAPMAAVGIATPIAEITACVSSCVSGGSIIVYGNYLGRGQKEETNKVFSTAISLCLAMGILFNLIMFIFPEQLATLLGANEELLPLSSQYIRGLSFSMIPTILLPTLLAFLAMGNHVTYGMIGMLVMAVCNLIFGYVATAVLDGGIMGMGMAVACSSIITAVFMCIKFIKNKNLGCFRLKDFDMKIAGKAMILGLPSALPTGLSGIRNATMFSTMTAYGGTAAAEALSVNCNTAAIPDCIYLGWASTTLMIASVLVGEGDTKTLKLFTKYSLTRGILAGFIAMLGYIALTNPLIALFKVTGEAVGLMKTFFILYGILTLIISGGFVIAYTYQALSRTKLLNIVYVFAFAVIPIVFMRIAAPNWGPVGIHASLPASMLALCIILYVVSWVKCGHLPTSISDLLWVDNTLEIPDDDKISFSVKTEEAVVGIAKKIQEFCLEKGVDNRRSMFSGLCLEEIASNIVEHGFPKAKEGKKHLTVDIFATVVNDEVTLRIRDNAPEFDPHEKLAVSDSDDPTANVGIHMVSKIAKEMNYQTTLGLNTLTVKL